MILKTINEQQNIYIIPSSYTLDDDQWGGSDVYLNDDETTIDVITNDGVLVETLCSFDGRVTIMTELEFKEFQKTYEEEDRMLESFILLKNFIGEIKLSAFETDEFICPLDVEFDMEELAMYQNFGVNDYTLAIVIPVDCEFIVIENDDTDTLNYQM